MLRVWGRRSSSNVQALMWCIGELGIEHTRIDAGFKYGVIDSRDYLQMNPNGTVPTIRDGENPPLWETGAILRYLAAQYSNDAFWPPDPVERARVDMWAEWAKINIAGKFTGPVFWAVARTPVERQDADATSRALGEFEQALAIADTQLQTNRYLAGDQFTLADIQFGHVLYRYYDISIDRAPLLSVAEYYERISTRAAFREHVAISYEELVDTK